MKRRASERTYLNLSKLWLVENGYARDQEHLQECTRQYKVPDRNIYIKRDCFGADLVCQGIGASYWVNSCVGNVAAHKKRFDAWAFAPNNIPLVLAWTPGRGKRKPSARCYYKSSTGKWEEA